LPEVSQELIQNQFVRLLRSWLVWFLSLFFQNSFLFEFLKFLSLTCIVKSRNDITTLISVSKHSLRLLRDSGFESLVWNWVRRSKTFLSTWSLIVLSSRSRNFTNKIRVL
jgi:hypothetical protein